MAMACFIAADLVHPHIDDENIRNSQTEQSHFFLKHLLFRLALWGIKTLCIYNINVIDVLEPDPLCTPLPCYGSVQYWKLGAKDMIQ